jgi:hypothetical protein
MLDAINEIENSRLMSQMSDSLQKKRKNQKDEPKQLDSFLTSSLNVELVYVILTSVVAFVKDR